MSRLALACLVLAGCNHGVAKDRRSGPACSSTCATNQLCYLDGNAPVSYQNPRCELLPIHCATQPSCECLANWMRITLCDETGPVPQVTYYAN